MSALEYYKNFLTKWPKEAGPKPTIQQLEAIHASGCRKGSKASLAASMYLRKDGATTEQVSAVVGSPQLNVSRNLIHRGVAKAVPIPHNADGHTVYKLALQESKAKDTKKPKATTKKAKAKNTAEDGTSAVPAQA
jgi:hypothetical protein